MKPQWLDNKLISGPFFTLCLNEKHLKHICKHLNIECQWKTTDAFTIFVEHPTNKPVCIVVLNKRKGIERNQIYALLVHEAVHVFQEYCNHIGELNPSSEFEAYSIQWISQQLMYEYDRLNRR